MYANPLLKLLMLATVFSACTATKSIQTKPKLEDAPLFMYFVAMEMKQDKVSHTNSISTVQTTKLAEAAKKEPLLMVNGGNYLSILAYKDGKLLDSQTVQHPLHKQMEFMENNILTSKDVTVDRAEFFVRMALPEGPKELLISETINGKPTPFIASIKLEN